jgi:NADH-quinone oxidoreductase subunit L
VTVAVLAVVLVGAGVAYRKYIARDVPPTPPEDVSVLTRAARADLYGDAFNEAAFMRPGQKLTNTMVFADKAGIDAVVDGVGRSIGGVSTRSRRLQTGFVRSYALAMFAGAVLVVLMVVVL